MARSQRQVLPAAGTAPHAVPALQIRTEAYDSVSGHWTVTGAPHDDLTTNHAYCRGTLYFMTCEALNGILAYHMARGTWTRLRPPAPLAHLAFACPFVVACRGDRLLMVAGYGRRHMDTEGVGVWELLVQHPQRQQRQWVEVSRMPPHLLHDFVTQSGSIYFNCVALGGTVYLINYCKPPLIATFSVADGSWDRLRTCPPALVVHAFLCFSFFPTLDAVV